MADRSTGLSDLSQPMRVGELWRARRRRRRLLVGGAVAVVLGVLAWLVWGSSLLSVDQVRVDGLVVLTNDEVVAAAEVALGEPLARVEVAQVAQRVAALPPVAGVTVHRNWPHTLRLEITEHQAVLQRGLAGDDGAVFQWINADGVVFHTDATRLAVPLVQSASEEPALLADVAAVAAHLPPDLMANLTAFEAVSRDQISFTLSDGRQVVWGSAEESELKAQVIAVLLDQPGTVYNVSAPGHPAVS